MYAAGTEPDPRFTLANERTFLAWIRTALALIAAGVALHVLPLPSHAGYRTAASDVLLLLGLVTPVTAWVSWGAAERAMRTGRPLPASVVTAPLAAGVLIAAALIALGVLLP